MGKNLLFLRLGKMTNLKIIKAVTTPTTPNEPNPTASSLQASLKPTKQN